MDHHGHARVRRAGYHYRESGLDTVWLHSGVRVVKDENGEEGVAILDSDALHAAIARALIERGGAMTAKEVRYLRVWLDLSQAALGRLLGMADEQAVWRWEVGRGQIPPPADRLLRAMVASRLAGDVDVMKQLTRLQSPAARAWKFLDLAYVKKGGSAAWTAMPRDTRKAAA